MTKRQGNAPAPGETRWVNLGRACEILGVNESTIRRWADAEQIRCFRTPGGHRRFAEADLIALTEGGVSAPDHELQTAAVRRIRRRLNAGSEGSGWYAETEEDVREASRPLGRRLVELVENYISTTRRHQHEEIEEAVDEIGRSYGAMLYERDTPLLQAMQAFTFFRRSLDDTAKQLAERNSMSADDAARAREAIAGLADRVLLGVTSAFDSPSANSAAASQQEG
ncbi:MAG TPA: helix-turn-helix domain-containing protein [Dehalococcoidia bacterium]|nr:helix-turn-helix domain-containing protein [Dehalococcoidia bacterium]